MIYVANGSIGQTGGGDAVVAMEILNSLNSKGFDVAAISRRYKIPDDLAEDFSKVKNYTFPFFPNKENYSKNKFGSIRYLLKKAQSGFYLNLLNRQFSKHPPELMIANDFSTAQYFLDKFQNNGKVIYVVHSIPEFYDKFKGLNIEEHIDLINRADSTVFVSEASRKKWLHHGVETNRTCCIYNCANENSAKKYMSTPKSTVRKQLNMSSEKFYLVTVASFNYEKGLDLLLDAAPELKKIAPNLEILLIGSDKAKYFEYYKGEVNNGTEDFMKILGFKENAMEYIYAADTFILPSRVEGFPLVILESMILKTPVIASSVGGIPEMIEHDKTGLLFESENVEELVDRFRSMYMNRGDRDRYTERASNRYWETFSKSKFTENYLKLANSL